jgi:hypothetical protein
MAARPGKAPTTLRWRETFDTFERPLATASEALVQTNVFMDVLAVGWRVQRRLLEPWWRSSTMVLNAFNVPSRHDVRELQSQVGALERQVRALRTEDRAPVTGLRSGVS